MPVQNDKNSAGHKEAERRIEEARKSGAVVLDLSDLQLTGVPEGLGQLNKVTTLYLHSNKLQNLPEALGQLTNLRELYLSHNRLQSLPEWLGHLSSLTTLHLEINKLQSLPDSLGDLKHLRELDLHTNKLQRLPEGLRRLEQWNNLKELYLHYNPALAIPRKILGPTPYEVGSLHATAADPFVILRYYFRSSQQSAISGQL